MFQTTPPFTEPAISRQAPAKMAGKPNVTSGRGGGYLIFRIKNNLILLHVFDSKSRNYDLCSRGLAPQVAHRLADERAAQRLRMQNAYRATSPTPTYYTKVRSEKYRLVL
jgi:hypothetical protein